MAGVIGLPASFADEPTYTPIRWDRANTPSPLEVLGASVSATLPDIISTLMHAMPYATLPQTSKSAKLREQAATLIAQAEKLETVSLQERRCERAQRVILGRLETASERLAELTAAKKERKQGAKELAKLEARAEQYQARADTARDEWSRGIRGTANAVELDALQQSIVLASTQLHSAQLEIDAVSDRLSEVDAVIDGEDVETCRADAAEFERIAQSPAECMRVISAEAAERRRGDRFAGSQVENESAIMRRELAQYGDDDE
jgi:hypothetical protein